MQEPTKIHQRFDRVTILFHWVTAALVIALFGSAMVWSYAPRDWGLRWLSSIHASLGIALALIVAGRLVWRLTIGRRLPDAPGNRVAELARKALHLALYALLVLQIALGFGLEWFGGEALSFFGLFVLPSPFTENRNLGELLEQMHNVVAWSIMVLVGGHAIAALWHHYVGRDGVLKRMIWSRTAR